MQYQAVAGPCLNRLDTSQEGLLVTGAGLLIGILLIAIIARAKHIPKWETFVGVVTVVAIMFLLVAVNTVYTPACSM